MTTSFLNWLDTQASREDNIGRFARDVAADAEAPSGNSMDAWQAHLKECGAGQGATQALHDAWAEFLRMG
jgi:hypothetical protein